MHIAWQIEIILKLEVLVKILAWSSVSCRPSPLAPGPECGHQQSCRAQCRPSGKGTALALSSPASLTWQRWEWSHPASSDTWPSQGSQSWRSPTWSGTEIYSDHSPRLIRTVIKETYALQNYVIETMLEHSTRKDKNFLIDTASAVCQGSAVQRSINVFWTVYSMLGPSLDKDWLSDYSSCTRELIILCSSLFVLLLPIDFIKNLPENFFFRHQIVNINYDAFLILLNIPQTHLSVHLGC